MLCCGDDDDDGALMRLKSTLASERKAVHATRLRPSVPVGCVEVYEGV